MIEQRNFLTREEARNLAVLLVVLFIVLSSVAYQIGYRNAPISKDENTPDSIVDEPADQLFDPYPWETLFL